jgi:hypothetical protein
MINVVTFRAMTAEAASLINVSEVIASARTVFSKRNLGYGFNIGSASVIPSTSVVVDNDVADSHVFAPVFAPVGSSGG